MALIILSKEVKELENILLDVVTAAFRSYISFSYFECRTSEDESIEIGLSNNQVPEYNREYFLMILHTKEWQKVEDFNIVNLMDETYHILAGTDNAPEKLCYDFALAYLRICPSHLIWMHEEFIFTAREMEKIEENGGFYEGWSSKINR